jgi:hypothetical protein
MPLAGDMGCRIFWILYLKGPGCTHIESYLHQKQVSKQVRLRSSTSTIAVYPTPVPSPATPAELCGGHGHSSGALRHTSLAARHHPADLYRPNQLEPDVHWGDQVRQYV